MSETPAVYQVLNAATGEPIRSGMEQLWVTGRILPVGAHLVVRHVFTSGESEPLEAIYAFGLPREAALRRFRVESEGLSVASELRPTEEATKQYERGLEEGHLSALSRVYRDGLVNLTLGNVRPGETVTVLLEVVTGVDVHDDGFRFRFPFTLAPGYHRDLRVSALGPEEGEMELPEAFGDLVLPRWRNDVEHLHGVGFQLEVTVPQALARVASPSHAIDIQPDGTHGCTVSLARASDVPDRDLVLDIATAEPMEGLFIGDDPGGGRRFAAHVPSARFGALPAVPRRVVFVLDRSGSMQGTPLEQAKKALLACLGALGDDDRFGLVVFDSVAEVMGNGLRSPEDTDETRVFLAGVAARGGTEMEQALNTAAHLLGGDAGDIMLITDGQVFGGDEIAQSLGRQGHRVHSLGIGTASTDRFLSLLAGATGGVSRFLSPHERVDMGALELFAAIGRPVATGLEVVAGPGVTVEPTPAMQVFQGKPWVCLGHVDGPPTLGVTWPRDGGQETISLDGLRCHEVSGETLKLIQGARITTFADTSPQPDEAQTERLAALAREYGLANSAMALVAVVTREGDTEGMPPKSVVVPVGLPEGMRMDAYFGVPEAMDVLCEPGAVCCVSESYAPAAPRRASAKRVVPSGAGSEEDAEELLVDIASRLTREGSLPGDSNTERMANTLIALIAFAMQGHTEQSGPFAVHIARMQAYLARQDKRCLTAEQRTCYDAASQRIASPPAPGQWRHVVRALRSGRFRRRDPWQVLGKLVGQAAKAT